MASPTTAPRQEPTTSPVSREQPGPERPRPQRGAARYLVISVVLIGLVMAGLLTAGVLPRLWHSRELQAAAEQQRQAIPVVQVNQARRASPETRLMLPGTTVAFREAAIYARTNGYLTRWLVDIGDRVQADQLLAEIATPEIDDELQQARATLVQSQANLEVAQANARLARTTLARSERAGVPAVTPEEIEQQQATVGTTTANVAAARAAIRVNEANVQRLEDLQHFERVTAPFGGTITARNVDPGDLITAGNSGREMFHLAEIDVLRVFVTVPQSYAPMIRPGQPATMTVREYPGRTFAGTVSRTAGALQASTRTLLTQVDVPNKDFTLMPGQYAQVLFILRRAEPPVIIPAAGLINDAQGTRVAVVDAASQLHYRRVDVGRDYGSTIEIVNGLAAGETVVVNEGANLPDGITVRPASTADVGGNPVLGGPTSRQPAEGNEQGRAGEDHPTGNPSGKQGGDH